MRLDLNDVTSSGRASTFLETVAARLPILELRTLQNRFETASRSALDFSKYDMSPRMLVTVEISTGNTRPLWLSSSELSAKIEYVMIC